MNTKNEISKNGDVNNSSLTFAKIEQTGYFVYS